MQYPWTFLLIMISSFEQDEAYSLLRNSPELDFPPLSVWYSPYAKQWNESGLPPTIPPKNSYSSKDIRTHLEIISTTFSSISTRGMGLTSRNYMKIWNETYPECLIATEAAKFNRDSNSLKLVVLQGAVLSQSKRVRDAEVRNAITSAQYANSIYPFTVWGIVLISDDDNLNNNDDAENALLPEEIVDEVMLRLEGVSSIKVGVSMSKCTNYSLFHLTNAFNDSSVDFVMCQNSQVVNNDDAISLNDVEIAVNASISYFTSLLKINNVPKIIFNDMGWPTLKLKGGYSKNDVEKVEKFRNYWTRLTSWALALGHNLVIAEAFDQPHYCDVYRWSILDFSTKRKCFLGWWVSFDGNEKESFYEKVDVTNDHKDNAGDAVDGWVWVWIMFGVFGVVLVSAVGTMIILKGRNERKRRQLLTESEINQFLYGGEMYLEGGENGGGSSEYEAMILPYDQSLELSKDMMYIDLSHVIGSGAFGTVYKGSLMGHQCPVAFKTLNRAAGSTEMKDLLSEIKIMSCIGKHDHIISLLGAFTKDIRKGTAYICLELCSKGNLQNYLRRRSINGGIDDETNNEKRYINGPSSLYLELEHTNKSEGISTKEMIQWSLEIANAMNYLESKKVLHGDLATRNVLLTGDLHAKVTDFGLSRRLYEYTNYVKRSQEPLPWRWLSIESLTQLSFSSKSDCWSYGVTLWEIFSEGDVPYPGLNWTPGFTKLLQDGLRLSRPSRASEEIFNEIAKCWYENPKDRPTFQELMLFFSKIIARYEPEYKNIR